MAQPFKLPDLGEGIQEAEIVEILVSEGDEIQEGTDVLVVETDKAAVDLPSPFSAEVSEIHVEPGQRVQVDDVLITFSGEGEGHPDQDPEEQEPDQESDQEPQPSPQQDEERERPVPASPSTRRLARELEVDLTKVPPSGPGGRVTAQDVESFAQQDKKAPAREEPEPETAQEKEATPKRPESPSTRPSAIAAPSLPDFTRWGPVERHPLRSVRLTIAQRMARAWSQVPHVNHQDLADVTEIERFRRQHQDRIEKQGGQLTLTVLAMKAVVAALKEHPRFNASLDPDASEIVFKQYYHLGIAVDTDRGLIVPVIRDVDRKSLTELSVELVDLVERTRNGEAVLEDLQGGTFTITNVGPIGGTAFSPIVNYPEVAILGMGRARWQPVVRGQGDRQAGFDDPRSLDIEPRYMLPLMLGFDHRVADGADAAHFVRSVAQVLEDPDQLMLAL